jgi:uncharacterized repeat protein (TIGR01451 family)
MFQSSKRSRRFNSRNRRNRFQKQRIRARRFSLETLEPRLALTGTWTALAHAAPNGIGTMELLSDGTVIGTQGKNWYKLAPDSSGSYVNGTWSTMASMSLERLYDATNVLKDGRVLVVGGEYSGPNLTSNDTNTGEIYNPVTNSWSSIPNFPQNKFGDDPSMVLPDGRVLTGYISGPQTYIYDPVSNTWSNGPTKLYNDGSDEETWTKLPDGSILSYDIFGNPQHAQRLDVSNPDSTQWHWVDAGSVPVPLADSASEIGPAVLLPDGRVFQIGATSNTAFYTPPTSPGDPGTWTAGPTIPSGFGTNDGPAAMMPNGHVLFAADAISSGGSPTKIFEFDPSTNTIADVTPSNPNLSGSVAFPLRMLVLPSGQVLLTTSSNQLYAFTPNGSPQTAWKPTITTVAANGDHFTLTGTQLNGISAGASYGDDAEMDTNYPIVRLTSSSGKVYYARTSNWSSPGVATGSAPITTDFALPANMPNGTYSLAVIANGIASNSVNFTGGIVASAADLIVTNSGPSNSTEGSNLTFNLTVTNNGPTSTTNVVLTNTLDPNLKYVSSSKSTGTVTQSGSTVTFSFGNLAVGQTVTASVTAQALDGGNFTDSATATSSLPDANPFNNSASVTVPVTDPPITVSAPLTTTSQTLTNQTVATFTHASGVEPVSAFVATINWGDATTSTGTITKSGSTYSVIASHTYAASGTYTIVTTVVEPTTPLPPQLPWTPLVNLDPATSPGTMELLSDGSVMVEGSDNQSWNKLTPDATGSYVNGTWSTISDMSTPRLYDATNVLPDGRVLVLGGVASDGTFLNTGEIYNPLTNTWTSITNFPESTFGNGRTMLLPDGRVLAGSIAGPQTYIYDPATDKWSDGPTKLYGDPTFKEVWTKLADGSILSYDVTGNPQEAQRLDVSNPDPSQWQWVDAGSVPVSLQSGTDDLGPAVLLPDGRVFQIGANSNTAIYTPPTPGDGTNGAGSWVAGPVLPNGLIGGQTANNGSLSAAMLPNGHVLLVGGHGVSNGDTNRFYEFDPAAFDANPQDPQASLIDVTPTNATIGGVGNAQRMLMLPSGQVLAILIGGSGGKLYTYTPTGAPQVAWQPTITRVVANGNHYTLTGTQLNGVSAGATYGVGNEMDTNYPIIELAATDGSGKDYFARTSNWSSTGVATGSTAVTTDFALNGAMPYGTYSLTVVANGIASLPWTFIGGTVGPVADLVVSNTGVTTGTEGDTITYSLTVTNNGPYSAPNVVLTDVLGANLSYGSSTKSQGSSSRSGSTLTFNFGSLGVGQTVTATVTAQAIDSGNLTNTATVASSIAEANASSNVATATTAVADAPIVVSGPISVNGTTQSGITVATFTHFNGSEPASAFTATIDWGDGTTSLGTISQGKGNKSSTYTVKGSHTYSIGGTHTVTTTVVEASSGGGSMSALAGVNTSTPTDSTSSELSPTQVQPVEADGSPPYSLRDVVDHVISTMALNRSRRSLHTVDDTALDDLFASV